jgi:chemosensory pili system protein ChpA (sensor histidine kinase/response regulator)
LDVLQHIEDWLPTAFSEADFTQNQVIKQAGLKLDDQMSLGEVLAFNSVPAASETFPQTLVEKMFVDEAQDLLSQAELNLQQWIKERHQRHLLLELQRIFHRLTRSARLLELKYVMDITTRLEITFERMNLHNSKTSSYDPLLLNAVQWLRLAIFDTRYDHYH